jgi:hypothetical protein
MVYDSGRGEVFVTSQDNTTSVISDSTNSVVAVLKSPGQLGSIAYDSAKSELWMIDSYNTGPSLGIPGNSFDVISDSNYSRLGGIGLMTSGDLVYDSAKSEIFLTDACGFHSNLPPNDLLIFNDNSYTPTAQVTVGNSPSLLAYDSGKGEIFVADTGYCNGGRYHPENNVTIVSDSTDRVVGTVNLAPQVPGQITGIAYDSGKGEIFLTVSRQACDNPGPNCMPSSVAVISDATNSVVATVSLGQMPFSPLLSIAYDSAKGEVLVAGINRTTILSTPTSPSITTFFDTLVAISDSSNTIVNSFNLGNLAGCCQVSEGPSKVLYDPVKGEAFVGDGDNGVITIIPDSVNSYTSTATVVATGGSGNQTGVTTGITSDSTGTSSSTSPSAPVQVITIAKSPASGGNLLDIILSMYPLLAVAAVVIIGLAVFVRRRRRPKAR